MMPTVNDGLYIVTEACCIWQAFGILFYIESDA